MRNILSIVDAYKISHKAQLPKNCTKVVVNWTARGTRISDITQCVFFGLQYFIKHYLIQRFNDEFFSLPKDQALKRFKRRINNCLGPTNLDHFDKLHDLGYLPIKIMALPEGRKVPLRVPCVLMFNTHPDFFWLTNYLETMWSAVQWGQIDTATIAHQFAKTRDEYLLKTCTDHTLRMFLIHDFSARGMFGPEAMEMSGAAFLLSSHGTDTIAAIDFIEEYYNGDSDKEVIGMSIPASEHLSSCAGTEAGEEETLIRFLTEIYPTGPFSFVSDTWDYFGLLNVVVRRNRDLILSRNGKIVFRPDSSPKTPLEIICGDPDAEEGTPERKGSLELLWEIFGGTINELGYRVLDSHVGLIYGEAITMKLYEQILDTMQDMMFASSNLVVGIGSYSFQMQSRDTFGQASKSTFIELQEESGIVGREIYKSPKTDSGVKKSAKGLTAVYLDAIGSYYLVDQISWAEVNRCALEPVFENGKLLKDFTFEEVRENLSKYL